jgi:hypothetical protein
LRDHVPAAAQAASTARASCARYRVKEVKVSDIERFVICHNPDAAERDAHIRAQLVAQLEELIAGAGHAADHETR